MKTIFFTVTMLVFIICPATLKAQTDHRQSRGNGNAGVVINNYYGNYDYFYSSRINRFHRSYAAFKYYSPVFTESYWYNPMSFTWGISIYGAYSFYNPWYSPFFINIGYRSWR